MLKVYNQPINKLKRIVFDVSQKTEELAVRQLYSSKMPTFCMQPLCYL